MTNEVLKVLYAMLPYGVKCYAYQFKIDGNDCECCGTLTGINNGYFYLSNRTPVNGGKTYDEHYLEVKPYLRPMSSMTEEELFNYKHLDLLDYSNDGFEMPNFRSIDWLLAHHFDFRGLIPMGLALEAPEDMYK